ncbi:zinc ribbon domain-containing protein [Kitasatospora sp. NPDC101157]|uniref:zinc ribbon domain-containing protein n=1 Tax=Kitasatospora sp. NPDC101157 TaxID=3364098 RepID=UPI003826E5F0
MRCSYRRDPATGQGVAPARTFGSAAASVRDAGRSTLRRPHRERAARHGRHVGVIGRYEPTSRICSACGLLDGPKPLAVREWTCEACGALHDRDLNASRNILAAGRADRPNACGGPVRPGAAIPCQAQPVGTGTHRNDCGAGRKPRAARAAGSPRLRPGEEVEVPDLVVPTRREPGPPRGADRTRWTEPAVMPPGSRARCESPG